MAAKDGTAVADMGELKADPGREPCGLRANIGDEVAEEELEEEEVVFVDEVPPPPPPILSMALCINPADFWRMVPTLSAAKGIDSVELLLLTFTDSIICRSLLPLPIATPFSCRKLFIFSLFIGSVW